MSSLKMARHAGLESPSMKMGICSLPRPSSLNARSRQSAGQRPLVGEQRTLGDARVLLETLLQEPGDRRLRGADRTVEQDHALLGAVALGRALQHVDQAHERDVQAVDRVLAAVVLVLEEVVANQL